MTNTLNNEKKLKRNIDNIIRNYVKTDQELLETLANDDFEKFRQTIGSKSSDSFLVDIALDDSYVSFTDELFNQMKNVNESNIIQMKEEQKRLQEYEKATGKKTIKPKKAKAVKNKLVAKKNNPMKWMNKENNLVRRLIKSNTRSGDIIKILNLKRNAEGLESRTDQSVYNKISRIRKEEKEKE